MKKTKFEHRKELAQQEIPCKQCLYVENHCYGCIKGIWNNYRPKEEEEEKMKTIEQEELRFVDDSLFSYIPLPPFGEGIYKVQLIMTKDIFQECYNRWIKPEESEEI